VASGLLKFSTEMLHAVVAVAVNSRSAAESKPMSGKRFTSHLCKELVRRILVEKPRTRDCDIRLRWCVVRELGHDPDKLTFTDALRMEKNKLLPNAESIRRTRAKLQEEDTSLRGELYAERHEKQESWQTELGYKNCKPRGE